MFTALAPGIQVIFLTLVIGAAIFDVRYRRIPNWISVSGLVAGLALNAFPVGRGSVVFSMAGLVFSLKGFAVGFGLYFVLYALHAMGAGDAKLMGAIGARWAGATGSAFSFLRRFWEEWPPSRSPRCASGWAKRSGT